MSDIINFDKAANVQLRYDLIDNVLDVLDKSYNANSNHKLGRDSKSIIADTVSLFKIYLPQFDYIEFVPGGGTLANRRGILDALPCSPKRIDKNVFRDIVIISSCEHKSINETVCQELINRRYTIVKVAVSTDCLIKLDEIRIMLDKYKDRIALISIMNVNNEVGAIQNIGEISKMIKESDKNIIFHSDVCQGLYLIMDTPHNSPDIISFSMYKLCGIHLGVVAYKKEHLLRNEYYGTPDVINIYLSGLYMQKYCEYVDNFDDIVFMQSYIKSKMMEFSRNMNVKIIDVSTSGVPYIQSFLLPRTVEMKTVQQLLSDKNIMVGTGSACSSENKNGSHVITAMGYEQYSHSLLRLSYDDKIKQANIDTFFSALTEIITKLKAVVRMDPFEEVKHEEHRAEIIYYPTITSSIQKEDVIPKEEPKEEPKAVSYTHLTLPTIA